MALSAQQLRRLVPSTIHWRSQRYLKPGTVFVRKYSQKPRTQQINLTLRPPTQKKWNQLTVTQKVARTAATSGNLLIILAGLALTGMVITMFYLEVLSPDSKTNWFNRAVDRVKADERCLRLLGQKSSIKAYGEPTGDRWTRSRPIASTVRVDRHGVEHFFMQFNVEGDVDKGVVQLHLVKRPGQDDYDYQYFFLDVKGIYEPCQRLSWPHSRLIEEAGALGQHRVYLENADDKPTPRREKKGLFGVRWG